MSKLTVNELELQVARGLAIKESYEIVTYRDPNHPDVIRKVCPICGRVYDRYLLCVDGLMGCRRCALKKFRERCLKWLASNAPGFVLKQTDAGVSELRKLLRRFGI